MTVFQVEGGFTLHFHGVPSRATVKPVDQPVNHLVVIDCSGSMYSELPRIRQQLKNRLPTLVREGDSVSIIWFSGRGQFGTLVEGVEFNSLTDLQQVNAAIDRYLRPIGLTGFKEPLSEAKAVLDRLRKSRPNSVFSLFFLTDGYDNQWSQKDILDACGLLQSEIASSTLVEYGYCCNRPLMTKMAEQLGGSLIFNEDFTRYEPTFEAAVTKRLQSIKRVELNLGAIAYENVAWALDGNDLVSFAVVDGKVLVPEHLIGVYFLTESPVIARSPVPADRQTDPVILTGLYTGLVTFSQRMLPNPVFGILKTLGDVRLIKQFANCFGKQSYSRFQEQAQNAAVDPALRLTEGYDPNLVPADDAYTVLDLLADLQKSDRNLFYPYHPEFGYNRIGRQAVDTASILTEAEQIEVAELTAKAKTPAALRKVQERIDEIIAAKPVPLKFVQESENPGFAISGLTMNETRPNVSVMVKQAGTVNLENVLTEAAKKARCPSEFRTHQFRNYNIIRDGIVNTRKLPVSLCEDTFNTLVKAGVIPTGQKFVSESEIIMLDLTNIPTINRKMVKSTSAKDLFVETFELLMLKAANKVYNDYLKKQFGGRVSEGFEALYGAEVTAWLKEIGLDQYNGFSPKRVLAEATDYYTGKEIKVSLKGLSSLPKVDDVRTRIEKGQKLTLAQELIAEALKEVDAFLDSAIYKKAKKPEHLFETWLNDQLAMNRTLTRERMRRLSEIKFSVVVGQTWFNEFSSLDENSLEVDLPYNFGKLTGTVTLSEIQVEV